LYRTPDAQHPWANALLEQDSELFPDDWWPYGLAVNRVALDTFLRYHYEQGLSARKLAVRTCSPRATRHT
jgi:hypothetical protein